MDGKCVNKAFGYILETTQPDQNVDRVLSGRIQKEGARLPSLHALDPPIRDRALAPQVLLFASTLAFADFTLIREDAVADF
ncbi:hypothetical protein P3T76_013364 [Phytophthora citrophthora]|uniref:Uncharacterized protein n=1 Tax=Phytophthora citrophthora TaxID=4793 RepID=A0AAD9LCC0_9STRA|nr:hypothetical protein P3T76_013364 [Phytophthora citrophthora]